MRIGLIAPLVLSACVTSLATTTEAEVRPNVVLVLADDMGYGEIEALNPDRSKIPTPNLNRLAAEGRVFSDAHTSSSVCTPTRYSLLTGRYNWRTRLQSGVLNGHGEPLIAADRLTLGGFFQRLGYTTAVIGKWHLNYHYESSQGLASTTQSRRSKARTPGPAPVGSLIPDGPLTRGFDAFFGFHHARSMSSIARDDRVIREVDVDEVLPLMTDEVVRCIERHAQPSEPDSPFFIYYAMSSPHTPIVPTEEWIGRGTIGRYSDFVAQTDGAVGEVMAALERNGLADNTIFIFSSDNGTSRAAGIGRLQERGHYPSGSYRGSKADLWDGGHRVPFIVRWPGRVAAASASDQLLCLSDLMATFAELYSVELDANTAEDSVSFLPALLDTATADSRTEIVHHSINGRFAIRRDNWKLLLAPGSGGWSAPTDAQASDQGLPDKQLFDLTEDPGEQSNLIKERPELASELVALLQQIVDRGRSTPGPLRSNDVEVDIFKQ